MARGVVGAFEHPKEGRFQALRTPVRFKGLDDPDVGTPPTLGDSTDRVLQARLGLTRAELASLRAEGAI
jgi:crotonobetainyl-CoA:carnitine CoA-transferase CaiB-like acyl-CoA transferase